MLNLVFVFVTPDDKESEGNQTDQLSSLITRISCILFILTFFDVMHISSNILLIALYSVSFLSLIYWKYRVWVSTASKKTTKDVNTTLKIFDISKIQFIFWYLVAVLPEMVGMILGAILVARIFN